MTARPGSRLCGALAASALLLLLALPAPAVARDAAPSAPEVVISPAARPYLPHVSAQKAISTANRTAAVRSELARHERLSIDIQLFRDTRDWNVGYFDGDTKVADITVDGDSGEVVEAWKDTKAAWAMARGRPDFFGEVFQSWYVWIPLCLLFVLPFFDPRRPFRMLHLDLVVLVAGFGLSHFFFNKGEIGTSVPLVYPVLAYLLVRLLVAAFRPRRTGEPLVPFAPAAFFVVAILLLVGFRVGMDLADGKVGDVGYASAVGAWRIDHGQPLYQDSGPNDPHFDTYGPVNYLAYNPF